MLDEMDSHGVQRAILMDTSAKPSVTARKFVEAHPDRFALAMGGINLLRPIPSLRRSSRRGFGPAGRAIPLSDPASGETGSTPPSDAVYYPLYTKCAEMELPLCVNTGIPGPPIPGRCRTPSISTGCACASRS